MLIIHLPIITTLCTCVRAYVCTHVSLRGRGFFGLVLITLFILACPLVPSTLWHSTVLEEFIKWANKYNLFLENNLPSTSGSELLIFIYSSSIKPGEWLKCSLKSYDSRPYWAKIVISAEVLANCRYKVCSEKVEEMM